MKRKEKQINKTILLNYDLGRLLRLCNDLRLAIKNDDEVIKLLEDTIIKEINTRVNPTSIFERNVLVGHVIHAQSMGLERLNRSVAFLWGTANFLYRGEYSNFELQVMISHVNVNTKEILLNCQFVYAS